MEDAKNRGRFLTDYCQFIKGVGPTRAHKLARLGIENVNDLLTHYPRTYYDRTNIGQIAGLQPGTEGTILGQILTSSQRKLRSRSLVTAAVGDDTGIIQIVWFNQPYLFRHLKAGSQIILSGQLRFYQGQRQIVNPEFEIISEELDQELLSGGRIVPVYRLTAGLSQRFFRTVIATALDLYRDAVEDNLPAEILEKENLPSRADAVRWIHFPPDRQHYGRAARRLKLEELFYVQLMFSLQRKRRLEDPTRPQLDVPFALEAEYLAGLPFRLTAAQSRVLNDIHSDLSSSRGMNRLLQGDVGSGKTVVAGATLLAAAEAGRQSALMVPTEILATQHFQSLEPHFDRLGVRSALLVGSLNSGRKKDIHKELESGRIQIAIGTHALIQSGVRFKNLGVVVIDEQHRFGVRQRAALMRDDKTPHMLVMTATPIPRTLALTAYADLDLSVIDEMPATRAPVATHLVKPPKRDAMYEFVRQETDKGARAYFLYPVIEETEKMDLEAAVTAFGELAEGAMRGVPMGLLHGKLAADEKARVMKEFTSGDVRILLATTVVEVGVHVPEATIMVVHHPERFGLSQLHQLRGRVGRGGQDGYCFLLLGESTSEESRHRLRVMVRESDGFKIAEEDLKIRGPGEFMGIRQHGVPGFRLANPIHDRDLVEAASRCVKQLMRSDPGLTSQAGRRCKRHLRTIVAEEVALRTVV